MDCNKCPGKKECKNANKNLGYTERGLTYCPMKFLFDFAWNVLNMKVKEEGKSK